MFAIFIFPKIFRKRFWPLDGAGDQIWLYRSITSYMQPYDFKHKPDATSAARWWHEPSRSSSIASRTIGILLACHWCFSCVSHRLPVICGLYNSKTIPELISAAMWRFTWYLTSSWDRMTTSLYKCAVHAKSLDRTVAKLFAFFGCSVL
jgi:hypothetical protein